MSTVESVTSITVRANADLSASQFCFVDLTNSANPLVLATEDSRAIGVLMNKPGEASGAAGEPGQVAILGCPKVIAEETFDLGENLAVGSTGHAKAADTTADQVRVAVALEAATAVGQVVRVLLLSQGQNPAA